MNKTKNIPLVSIGLAVYNGERFIREALDSLLAQNFKDFELIIVDNASEDTTQQICLEYASKHNRIQYYCNDANIGSKSFDRLLELSSGKYFMFAADHDLYEPNYISRCVEILEDDTSVIICYSQTMLIDIDGNELMITPDRLDTCSIESPSKRFHMTIWGLHWCNMMYGLMRLSALQHAYVFKPTIGGDNLLLAKLSLVGKFAQIPIPLFYRRENRPSESAKQALKRWLTNINSCTCTMSPYTVLMYYHLNAVANASITFQDKIKLIIDVCFCFNLRFGVWKELLYLPINIVKYLVCTTKQN
ncbi:MAG: glycosyltransferase family A protein [Candidatus Methanoperedens sp.]|jgi:glycosyltransferase involved in cell wall biosynthesis|nr:glycosyltransferase family A protein [Candidatus Methanoperedens sp.]PKL53737.1 MAG: hypothetical protein CVV36_05510 [Candidatus Methanoperedenaceae archaeon HGW-Methanoperedenaceae-1]